MGCTKAVVGQGERGEREIEEIEWAGPYVEVGGCWEAWNKSLGHRVAKSWAATKQAFSSSLGLVLLTILHPTQFSEHGVVTWGPESLHSDPGSY